MIGVLVLLFLLCALPVFQTLEVLDQIPLTAAELGDNLTLTCNATMDTVGLFYWYKVKFGFTIETVAHGTFDSTELKKQFKNSRFHITKNGKSYVLRINNVNKEDEAIYYCQVGYAYVMEFINGTVLVVNDPKTEQKPVFVKQSPDVKTVQLGNNITLQCSLLSKNKENQDECPAKHRVYWFRDRSEPHQGLVYTDSIKTDEEDRGCIYRLSKTIKDYSDSGTYYCAVVTCEEILFGKGTKVKAEQAPSPLVIVLWTLLGLSLIVIFALIVIKKKKPACEHCKGRWITTTSNRVEDDRLAEEQTNHVVGDDVGINYAALDFPSRKARRWKNTRELPEDCMYTGMRDYH
ncbi:uncharacterized protein KZ484_007943 [Pholidichthys leucotaenia]